MAEQPRWLLGRSVVARPTHAVVACSAIAGRDLMGIGGIPYTTHLHTSLSFVAGGAANAFYKLDGRGAAVFEMNNGKI